MLIIVFMWIIILFRCWGQKVIKTKIVLIMSELIGNLFSNDSEKHIKTIYNSKIINTFYMLETF